MLISIANLAAVIACLVIAVRLLLFRRGARRHHRGWAVLAWILINLSIALALHLAIRMATGAYAEWYVVAPLQIAALEVLRARGNTAKLMRFRS